MTTLQKTILMVWAAFIIALLVVLLIAAIVDSRDTAHDQIVAAAEDLGCVFIEQSYHHPERFYIDCGDDEIRILTVENK
jgi:uncharacterized Zn-finger protein